MQKESWEPVNIFSLGQMQRQGWKLKVEIHEHQSWGSHSLPYMSAVKLGWNSAGANSREMKGARGETAQTARPRKGLIQMINRTCFPLGPSLRQTHYCSSSASKDCDAYWTQLNLSLVQQPLDSSIYIPLSKHRGTGKTQQQNFCWAASGKEWKVSDTDD